MYTHRSIDDVHTTVSKDALMSGVASGRRWPESPSSACGWLQRQATAVWRCAAAAATWPGMKSDNRRQSFVVVSGSSLVLRRRRFEQRRLHLLVPLLSRGELTHLFHVTYEHCLWVVDGTVSDVNDWVTAIKVWNRLISSEIDSLETAISYVLFFTRASHRQRASHQTLYDSFID